MIKRYALWEEMAKAAVGRDLLAVLKSMSELLRFADDCDILLLSCTLIVL